MPHPHGQALVEFALIAPVLMLMLLGVLAGGMYFLAATAQQSATATLAGWMAEHPDATAEEADAFTLAVVPCPGGATVAYDEHVVIVTIACPSLAHGLIPAFPESVTTTATAYIPESTEAPSDSPEP